MITWLAGLLRRARGAREGPEPDVDGGAMARTPGPRVGPPVVSALGQAIALESEIDRRFRIAFEAAPNGFLMADDEGTILMANDRIVTMLGFGSAAEVVGKSVEMLIPESERVEHARHRDRFAAHPGARAMGAGRYLLARRADGGTLPVEIGLSPVRIDGRQAVLASVVDISDRLRMLHELEVKTRELEASNRELQVKTTELERSNRELETFAYVASHDLQEPLRMVASYVQLLSRRYQGRLDADADEFIGFALEGATRMRTLIGDLLAYARVQSGGRELEPCDSAAALARAIANLHETIEAVGAEIVVPDLPMVLGDIAQIAQLFENLVGNALKYRRDGVRPRVAIECEPEGARWRFSIIDNGIGIAPEFHDRIFVIFQRLHTREAYPGTGIGLAICQRIVERHGGHIGLESTPGAGSTFYFTLTAAPG